MKPYIITLIGEDKPGLLGSLADAVYQLQGNWLSSNFSLMAGRFAGFAEIHLPENQVDAFKKIVQERKDVTITLSPGLPPDEQDYKLVIIQVVGNDKPGIVNEVTAVINKQKINICKFESICESAPGSGHELFKATICIDVVYDFDVEQLVEALEEVADDLMIDVEAAN